MHKLIRTTLGATVLLMALAPAALAGATDTTPAGRPAAVDPGARHASGPRGLSASLGGVILAIRQDVVVEAGDHADALILIDGSATVRGTVDGLVVVDGTATLEGASVNRILVADGTVNADAATVVRTSIAQAKGHVFAAAGAQLPGIRDMEGDAALVALALAPLLALLGLGAIVLVYAIALLVAALGARQVRDAGAAMAAEPWKALVAGVAASVALPLLATLLIVTVVGAPVGLAMIFAGLPLLAFAGWLVAAIWVGDRVLARLAGNGSGVTGRFPFRAAVVGVTILTLAGMLPAVGAIATIFGTGALLLTASRGFRPSGAGPVDARPEAPTSAPEAPAADETNGGHAPLWGPAAPAAS